MEEEAEQFVFGAVESVLGQQDRDGQLRRRRRRRGMASLGKRGRRLSVPRGHDGDRGGGLTLG